MTFSISCSVRRWIASIPNAARCLAALLLALWLGIPARLAAAEKPDLHLLLVGTGQFQDPRISTLHYVDDDLAALRSWAEGQQGRLYEDVHIKVLGDSDASRANIVAEMLRFPRAARASDQVIVYISGHGVVERETRQYHYLPFDTRLENVAGTALEYFKLISMLESGGSKKKMLIVMDTCHSGAAADSFTHEAALGATQSGMEPTTSQAASSPAGVSSSIPAKGTQEFNARVAGRDRIWAVYTATIASQVAVEGTQYRHDWEGPSIEGHGLFTWALLDALGTTHADVGGDGTVSLAELTRHVDAKMRSLAFQKPVLSGNFTDVALGYAPGSQEKCDGIDNNLDGRIDEGFPDDNQNGVADCLDQELCNGRDDNNNGLVDEGFDLDRDGRNSAALCGNELGDDCDDGNIAVHPGQKDWGNLRDDDCDGMIDEDDFDKEGDGIPDLMQSRTQGVRRAQFLTLGAAAGMFVGAATSYLQLYGLRHPDETGDPGSQYHLDEQKYRSYRVWSGTTCALAGAGALTFGVSVRFGLQNQRLRLKVFPKSKKPQSTEKGTASR